MQCSHMPTAETVKYERQLHEVGRGNSHLSSNGATVTSPTSDSCEEATSASYACLLNKLSVTLSDEQHLFPHFASQTAASDFQSQWALLNFNFCRSCFGFVHIPLALWKQSSP